MASSLSFRRRCNATAGLLVRDVTPEGRVRIFT